MMMGRRIGMMAPITFEEAWEKKSAQGPHALPGAPVVHPKESRCTP